MKKILNKLLTIILLIMILCNFTLPHYAMASAEEPNSTDNEFDYNLIAEEQDSMMGTTQTLPILGGVVELFMDAVKLFIVAIGSIVGGISSGLGSIAGNDGAGFITLYNILFNQLGITDINILELTWGMQRSDQKYVDAGDHNVTGPVLSIRQNIGKWYYGLRNLSIVILLCVLIYMGIRMAISTVAEDQAKYKKLLMYWFTALVLVFMLHYIIILVINLNTALVSIFARVASTDNAASMLQKYNDLLLERAFGSTNFLDRLKSYASAFLLGQNTNIPASLGAAFIYTVLNGMTFAFLMLYIRRMITVSFYILIAPIITITYPIDKIGDRKITGIKYMA